MNKDVIYIDVEDDITAIIGKIKACKENIIALVPPKHVGLLQSAVNLRLLDRMASTSHKRLVLITNNQALIALSSVAGIPVAKNLQSKPELAEISALSIDDGEDVIDGSQLPIGELEKTADVVGGKNEPSSKEINSINIDDKSVSVAALGTAVKKPSGKKSGVKVPNFTTFRKKLFIGIGAGVLLVTLLIWAFGFAPSAKVIITTRTTPLPVNTTVTLGGNAASDVSKGVIQTVQQQVKKDVSVDFDATGKKDIGNKATGTMTLSNVYSTEGSITVPAGSKFSSGNYTFLTTSTVVVPRAQFVGGLIPGKADVGVQAESPGLDYNLSARAYQSDSVDGITAQGDQMAGGTTKVVTVVTAGDIQTATTLLAQQSADTVKQQLIKQFTGGEVVISDSFTVNAAAPVSAPAVDAEATGKAKLTASTTYTITGIAKSDLELFINANLDKQLADNEDQRVYNNGIDKVQLGNYNKTDEVSTVKIIATAQIGPKIDEAEVKERVKGKIFGDVQSNLSAISGVDNVEVKFSYPWVRTVPKNIDKISVEFKLQNG